MQLNRGRIIDGTRSIRIKPKPSRINFLCFQLVSVLLQLQKRKMNRESKTNSNAATNIQPDKVRADDPTSSSSEKRETPDTMDLDSNDSDEQLSSDLSDSELDIDNYYFLQVRQLM